MATERDDTQTIVVGLKRKQTLVLPPDGRVVTFRKPRKGMRKGSAVLTVPKGRMGGDDA